MLCWWLWLSVAAGQSQDRAEVFPDILCSRDRWCSHAWPAWTTEHTLTLGEGPTPPIKWPGATFSPKVMFYEPSQMFPVSHIHVYPDT